MSSEQLLEKALAKRKDLGCVLQDSATEEDRAEFFRLLVAKNLISAHKKTGKIFIRRPRFLIAMLAGAGFEPATSGL
jgi:hypothetical protein